MSKKLFPLLVAVLAIILVVQAQAQIRPLQEITVQGTAMVDTVGHHVRYFLDTDNDSLANYRLNFGPPWYQPDSSEAVRPQNGDFVTITGGVRDSSYDSLQVLVVYEINGQFWRDPYDPFWLRWARRMHHWRFARYNHRGFAFGWINDSLPQDTLQGIVMVDSTFHFWRYYLNINGDSLPDYFLNFGPPWYQPDSLQRPAAGDEVTIVGFVAQKLDRLPMVFVKELNGQIWMDAKAWRHYKRAFRIKRHDQRRHHVFCPYDTLSGFWLNPGWDKNFHGPNEVIFQMVQLMPQDVAQPAQGQIFAAFQIAAFTPMGRNLMESNQHYGGLLHLGTKTRIQLHYNRIQELGFNVNEKSIRVLVWNTQTQQWQTVTNAEVDPNTNTVTYETESLNGLVALASNAKATSVDNDSQILPNGFVLKQNYPNPFNPTTTIAFEIARAGHVQLTIYNTLGQKLQTLLDQNLVAGTYKIRWNARNLPSGIYFYELKWNGHQSVRRMTLIK